MIGSKNRVLFPDSKYGLPDSEITIAEKLKENGYKTVAIGKMAFRPKERISSSSTWI